MNIRKIGRERPVLYRGKFSVPQKVISRLAVSKNHLILAQIANFNGKVDQFYLAIDNVLSAIIIAREGTLTTRDHGKKIEKFFRHFRRRAKIRSIDRIDFQEFCDLWSKSRYQLYFPSSTIVKKMGLFVSHLFYFAATEIARFFKSDETILDKKIDELLKIYQSEIILEEVGHIHEYRQMEAEHLGEIYGAKLGMKLANPWNFIEISLLTDNKAIADIVDKSEKIREILVDFLKSWDGLISEIRRLNLKRVALETANAKMEKRDVYRDTALKEAFEVAARHPKTWKFRLVLNSVFDCSEPKEIATFFSRVIEASRDMIKHPKKAMKNDWEIYKEYSRSVKNAINQKR